MPLSIRAAEGVSVSRGWRELGVIRRVIKPTGQSREVFLLRYIPSELAALTTRCRSSEMQSDKCGGVV